MFIQIAGFTVQTEHVSMVKPVDDEHCEMFMKGASPVDGGHLLNWSKEEVDEVLESSEPQSVQKLAEELEKELADRQKFDHEDVDFESPATGMDHCEDCKHYNGPDDCELVKPPIQPNDWCKRFRLKK